MTQGTLSVRVPATTANLGPGFDIFGLALNLYTTVEFHFDQNADYSLKYSDGRPLPIPPEKNLMLTSYREALVRNGIHNQSIPPWNAVVDSDVEIGKGFGSSASALVAGVLLSGEILNANGHNALSLGQELALLNELEGHPDNVFPARLGGFLFCYWQNKYIRKTVDESLGIAAIIPDQTLSTKKSRGKLPDQLPLGDALMNLQGCALWIEYLNHKNPDHLRQALTMDRIHEPYRDESVEGFLALRESLSSHDDIYGISLSGSGPGVIVFYDRSRQETVEKILPGFIQESGLHSGTNHVTWCSADNEGAYKVNPHLKIR